MKPIYIILTMLIVFGLGLFFTQKLWAPLVAVSEDGMESWNWVFSEASVQGIDFSYPNPLPTKYVTAEVWPPVVEMAEGGFSCTDGDVVLPDGSKKHLERRTIAERVYCVAVSVEGAAGSTYTSYEYSTDQDDFVARVAFTLRTPQCMNYDEPERAACTTEQAGFSADALADRIAESIRMQ